MVGRLERIGRRACFQGSRPPPGPAPMLVTLHTSQNGHAEDHAVCVTLHLMTFQFRPHDFDQMGIAPPRGWNPGRQPHQRPQTAAERQAKHRRVQWAIVNDIVHRCKRLHIERTRFEKHLGATAANRVLNARSRKDAIAQLRSLLDQLENDPKTAATR